MGNVKRKLKASIFSLLVLFSLFSSHSLGQLHFVSLGNFGKGSGAQNYVANTLKNKAKDYSVSFIISPGSNFLNGVTSLEDSKWMSWFEKPYEGNAMNLPFFTVVGVEDWKGNFSALPARTNMTYGVPKEEVSSETQGIPRWYLPNWWYYYVAHFSDSTGMSQINR